MDLKCYRCSEWPCVCQDGQTLIHGDFFALHREQLLISNFVLTDPPYAMTANSWDKPLDLPAMWDCLLLMSYDTAALAFTGSQPFTSELVMSKRHLFRHEWIWIKDKGSNFANTIREPFKEHESVLVFSGGNWTYNKQLQERAESGKDRAKYGVTWESKSDNYREFDKREGNRIMPESRVPSSWQSFGVERGLHPTQKPVKLFEYLVRTYSNEGSYVLDPFLGSGTTLVACKSQGRKGIGIEIEERYCEIAANRLRQGVLDFGGDPA